MTASNSKILRAKESRSPLIDGNEVTFFWEGKTAPTLVGDFNHWDPTVTPLKRISPRLQPASV